MHAFITHHPIASLFIVALVTFVVALALKRVDDWFKARHAFDRLAKFDAKLDAIAKRSGR